MYFVCPKCCESLQIKFYTKIIVFVYKYVDALLYFMFFK